jgi:Fe-S oxidoreductase
MRIKMAKLIFFGCLSVKNYQSTCENATKIIQSLDKEYKVLEEVPCCGSLAYHTASPEEIRKHVEFVNNWFKSNEITELVTICAGCYNYLSRYYPEYLGEEFGVQVQHIVQFLSAPKNLEKLNLDYKGEELIVTYHDPCHLRNAEVPLIDEPRKILNAIEGKIQLNEMAYNKGDAICCGSGGGVYSIFKENSDFNSNLILKLAKKQHVKAMITPCPFCYTALKRIWEGKKVKKTAIIKFEDFIEKILYGGAIG